MSFNRKKVVIEDRISHIQTTFPSATIAAQFLDMTVGTFLQRFLLGLSQANNYYIPISYGGEEISEEIRNSTPSDGRKGTNHHVPITIREKRTGEIKKYSSRVEAAIDLGYKYQSFLSTLCSGKGSFFNTYEVVNNE